ncbi:Nuclear pore complex protein NUP205 [Vitis vinifera]|uniref:Nuclear pore complex protein NUP205 n=1 Tax=Vitis vinifera TaxID=29760 RepID=A0A438JPU9_VITVI|nr:Nuclear pore complex protein NUP205 [Vitis vinifera]
MGREPLEILRLAEGLWYTERRDLITALYTLLRAVVLDQGLEADLVVDIQKYLEDLINTGLRQRLISLMKVLLVKQEGNCLTVYLPLCIAFIKHAGVADLWVVEKEQGIGNLESLFLKVGNRGGGECSQGQLRRFCWVGLCSVWTSDGKRCGRWLPYVLDGWKSNIPHWLITNVGWTYMWGYLYPQSTSAFGILCGHMSFGIKVRFSLACPVLIDELNREEPAGLGGPHSERYVLDSRGALVERRAVVFRERLILGHCLVLSVLVVRTNDDVIGIFDTSQIRIGKEGMASTTSWELFTWFIPTDSATSDTGPFS